MFDHSDEKLTRLNRLSKTIQKNTVYDQLLRLMLMLNVFGIFFLASHLIQHGLIDKETPSVPWPWVVAALSLHLAITVARTMNRHHACNKLRLTLQQQLLNFFKRTGMVGFRQHDENTWYEIFLTRIAHIENYMVDYHWQKKQSQWIPILILIIILPINWMAALILLMTLPLIPLFMWIVGVGTATAKRKHYLALDRLGAICLDRLYNATAIQLWQQENSQRAYLDKAQQELNQRTQEVVRLAFLNTAVLDFFSTLSIALIAVYIGFSLIGELNFGYWNNPINFQEGMFLLLLTPLFFAEFKELGRLYHHRSDALAAADIIEPYTRRLTTPKTDNKHREKKTKRMTDTPVNTYLYTETCANLQPISTKVATQNTPFKHCVIHNLRVYGNDNVVLLTAKKLMLTAQDKVQISGPSGAGKSVLVEAIMNLRTSHVAVQINQQTDTSFSACSQWLHYLGQKPVVLPVSIHQNFGGDLATHAIEQALIDVGLGSWLKQLPRGVHSDMGEYPPMSGGQAQRFALARVLLFPQPIVMLDEPTAHLTEHDHKQLCDLIYTLLHNKTVIWISHKPLDSTWFNQHWQVNAQHTVDDRTGAAE